MKTRSRKRLLSAILLLATTLPAAAIGKPGPTASQSEKSADGRSAGVRVIAQAEQARQIDWAELLPEDERGGYSSVPPPPAHDYLGEGGPAARQAMSFNVNPKLDGKRIRLPGFIVPLEVGKDGKVTEFFLVPYFGACIHVPPPPPNQIVHVTLARGMALDSIYEAYWVTGRLSVQNKSTRLGAAAYTLAADKVEIYKY